MVSELAFADDVVLLASSSEDLDYNTTAKWHVCQCTENKGSFNFQATKGRQRTQIYDK